jgi:hypothetical protein
MMSNSVYAEQISSAQIQGQQAARERATRARQETILHENAAVQQLRDSSKAALRERERERRRREAEAREDSEDIVADQEAQTDSETRTRFSHIDLTV